MATDLQKLFDEISSGLDLLQPRQVEIVATHVYRDKVTPLIKEALESYKDRQDSDVEWEAFHARTFGQEIKSDLQSSRYEAAEPEVDRFIKLNGLIIEKHSAVYKQLCRGVLIGLERVYQAAEKITEGNFEDSVFNFEPQIALNDESVGSTVTLKIAVDKYLAENQRDWTDKHYRSQKAKLEHFTAFMGEGCLESGGGVGLEQVSSNDARRYKELLQNTPANASKKYPDLTVLQVPDIAKQPGDRLLGTTSINNYIQCVSTLFSWAAIELDYQGPNHFKGRAKRVSGKSRRDERHPFSKDQLVTFFSSPLYTGCQSASRCHLPGKQLLIDSAKYWVPLIGFYTGMRLQEILQLYVTDIYESHDHWVIDLNEAHEDKKLKTGQSKRVIPMHPDLVEIGLIAFKERQEEKGSERLFPDATLSGDGTYSSTYSKWFSRYLKNIGIKTDKTSFHSFRHNMKDFFRAAGVSDELSEHYLGRLTGKLGEAYGTGYTIERFSIALMQIEFSNYTLFLSQRS